MSLQQQTGAKDKAATHKPNFLLILLILLFKQPQQHSISGA
jgi:hypothetical protein